MKKFLTPILAVLLCLAPQLFAQSSAADSSLEISTDLIKSSTAEAKLKAMVVKYISSKKSGEEVAKYISANDAMRVRLAQWRMFCRASATEAELKERQKKASEEYAKAESEFKVKIKEFQSTKDPKARDAGISLQAKMKVARANAQEPTSFAELEKSAKDAARFKALSADLEWLQGMMYSGEHVAIVRAVSIFLDIADLDPAVLKPGRKRDIASAIALEYTRNNWTSARAKERAEFYLKYWEEGRLNKQIDTLPMSQLRVMMGLKAEHKAGLVENYQYCLDNAHLPAAHYVGTGEYLAVCWRGTYRLNNIYGDSIHVNFYETYADAFSTYGQEVCEMGGICGVLSHFGAYAAAANGVAAQTMGEPGHCAYTVLLDGKWCPAYSLSWERWLHWHPWNDAWFFSALQFSYDLYDDKNIKKTMTAMDLESAALAMQDSKPQVAQALYNQALNAQPLNITTYRECFSLLAKNGDTEDKLAVLRCLAKTMPKTAPEMASSLLAKGMPLLDDASPDQRQAVISDYWQAINNIGPGHWDVAKLISSQADWVCKGAASPEKQGLNFYSKLLTAVVDKPDFTHSVMNWGNDWGSKQSPAVKSAMGTVTANIIAKASGKGASVETLLNGAIISAEKMGDVAAFNTLMKSVPEKSRYLGGMPTWEPFSGDLVSKGGLINLSSTCSHDTPTMHAGLLDPRGGKFHTDKDTDAWVTVKLSHVCQLSGVVIIPTTNSTYRQHRMCVQVSTTGEDGSWSDIEQLPDSAPARVTRVDMSKKQPKALYVRIKRSGGPEYFHLNGIYVYGKRVS